MSKPNFVFIMTDTQATNMVGCYTGIKALNTNHIDDLAKSGVKFNSGYTTTPVCTPARASLFTGLYSHSSGPWTNNIALGSNVKTMGQLRNELKPHISTMPNEIAPCSVLEKQQVAGFVNSFNTSLAHNG